MGKHIDDSSLSRDSLLRRYAKARGMTPARAAELFPTESRASLRAVVEMAESDVAGNGERARWRAGQTTTVTGLTR